MGHSPIEKGSTLPQELDVVKFLAPVGDWPAGTTGTVVDAFTDGGIVEVSDDEGRMLDLVSAPYTALEVVWSVSREHAV
jgi:hypothetical protein